jgi:hypothetical protein
MRFALLTAFVAGIISGCGEDQPNSARPEQVNTEFATNSADMMRKANTGMDPKQAKQNAPPTKK